MNEQIENQHELLKIVVIDFITRIQTSGARRPIYFEYGGKHAVPESKAKHIAPNGKQKFIWGLKKIGSKIKTVLVDQSTGEPVIKNARAAGTPKFLAIKGNNIYSGFGGYHNRVLIIDAIKNNFKPFFKNKKIEDFPIHLEFIFYDELNLSTSKEKNQTQDLDNLSTLYVKASQDLMKAEGIIPDDNLLYIRKITTEFIESSHKKLVIKAYKYKKSI
jgi:Holliday junction resolvase RusA-like endonuclease